MISGILLLAAATVSSNAGWEPLSEGGMKYIIQLSSADVEALQAGETLGSDIRSDVRDVRSYSIRLGTGKLPRDYPPSNAAAAAGTVKPQTSAFPPPLLQDQRGKPLPAPQTQQAGYAEPKQTPKAAENSPPAASDSSKPWLPLTLVSIFLFASLGANFYLLWLFIEIRRRYRATTA
jgi:hypothetical protein